MLTIRIKQEERTAVAKLEGFAKYVTSIDQGHAYLEMGNLAATAVNAFKEVEPEKLGFSYTEVSFTEIAVGEWGCECMIEEDDIVIYKIEEAKVVISEE